MKLRLSLACLCAGLFFGLAAARAQQPSLAGTWKLDAAASSPIKPWETSTLVITVDGPRVELTRTLTWGKERRATDVTRAVTDGRTFVATPLTYWLDTWYNNAYIGGDKQQHVTAEWLDSGRVLKLERRLTLNAQQGDVPVHIYDEYRLSPDGRTLKLFELRSTRDQPLVFVFTRA